MAPCFQKLPKMHQEGQRAYHIAHGAGVDVGMVDAAVLSICIFPVGWTLLLLTETLCRGGIAYGAKETQRTDYSVKALLLQKWYLFLY